MRDECKNSFRYRKRVRGGGVGGGATIDMVTNRQEQSLCDNHLSSSWEKIREPTKRATCSKLILRCTQEDICYFSFLARLNIQMSTSKNSIFSRINLKSRSRFVENTFNWN